MTQNLIKLVEKFNLKLQNLSILFIIYYLTKFIKIKLHDKI
jgi:hypothetical protein